MISSSSFDQPWWSIGYASNIPPCPPHRKVFQCDGYHMPSTLTRYHERGNAQRSLYYSAVTSHLRYDTQQCRSTVMISRSKSAPAATRNPRAGCPAANRDPLERGAGVDRAKLLEPAIHRLMDRVVGACHHPKGDVIIGGCHASIIPPRLKVSRHPWQNVIKPSERACVGTPTPRYLDILS